MSTNAALQHHAESGIEPVVPRPWVAAGTLCGRELVRFFRQRNRVVGAILQPVIFWLLFGAGLGQSFHMPGAASGGPSYREYFFPGTLVLIVLFTAIFATISIIEDRREGFLQSVLVAPIPRWSMVLGKILGGALIAMIQTLLFMALALAMHIELSWLAAVAVTGFLFVVALALTSLGFLIAWRMDSTQGFHAVMSVFLLPMWLLSGAFFPAPVVRPDSGWIEWVVHWLMRGNPLTYGVAGVRRLTYLDVPDADFPPDLPSMTLSLAVTLVFFAATFALAWTISKRNTTGDLL
jgi:ABC-2 type transport system permease protein